MKFTFIFICSVILLTASVSAQNVRVGTFQVDVTPLIGSPVAYAKTRSIADSLSARGIIIFSAEKPVILCAVDWIGIANEGQDAWKAALAKAGGTTPDRVSVHALHQHDGVRCDFTNEKVLKQYGLERTVFDHEFLEDAIKRVATGVQKAAAQSRPVTHIGFGEAMVEKVGSNRRIMGSSGKVEHVRWSKATDSVSINAPEGLIDPWLKSASLWNGNEPLAVLTYYATHPQSHYGKGDVTCEFVGIARNARQANSNIPHIHFTGAAGNVTAGKYNNGADSTRYILAERMERAMEKAWKNTKKKPLRAADITWRNEQVALPLGKNLSEDLLRKKLSDPDISLPQKHGFADNLAWLLRTREGYKANVSALKLADVWLLNLPGETFVEYQLAAQQMRKDDKVCTAAYDEYGPGYIGTKVAYAQGGYETTGTSSCVSPEAEAILLRAIKKVLR